MNPLQQFVFYRTYSRWNEELKRRETWEEAVERYFTYFKSKFGDKIPKKVWEKSKQNVFEMKTMPSMRAFWTAGPALDATNVAGYNCSYVAFDSIESISELFYVLMCGTGVGFSVENEHINKFPIVQQQTGNGSGVFVIPDSKEGWADSLKVGLTSWFNGQDIEFDYSQLRKRGAKLKTMGGRSSGPEPLRDLHKTTRDIVLAKQNQKLSSLDFLDIGNKIAEVVVVGGVRRSSEITFSDLNDSLIRDAKDFSKGTFPVHRFMSNNSAVYNGKPTMVEFMREWTALAASGSGERGIFNSQSSTVTAPRRKPDSSMRTNPCGEIYLRSQSFCNLSEVVVRPKDTFEDLSEKVKTAVWLGAMQACLTDFPYLRPIWKKNCEEERLLGVSLTGQLDNPKALSAERLSDLREVAIREAKKACKALGINLSVAITTGKPSGTVSLLVNSASGAHPRFDKYYIRRVRISSNDPLCKMLLSQGVKMTPENGQGPERVALQREKLVKDGFDKDQALILVPEWEESQVDTWVISFPEKAPEGAITRHQMTAIDQLEWYKKVRENWCEHNQSITIYVRDEEWLEVGNWVYNNFDKVGGLSFLPFDGGNYQQAPYEAIDAELYQKMVKSFPKIDYTELSKFEQDDQTTGAQNLACSSGACEMP